MFATAQQCYLNFYNPLIGRTYNAYPHLQKSKEAQITIEDFFNFSMKNVGWVVKELEPLKDKEFIAVDDYLAALQKVNAVHKAEFLRAIQRIANNQDQIIAGSLELINTSLKMISDEQTMEKMLESEKDLIKKSYFPAVIRIQKTVLGDLRDELENAQKSPWKIAARIPLLKYFALGQRLKKLQNFNRAMAATNILVIRLIKMFDKDKIKKEVTQAYEEFADASMLEPKHKFDKYNEYIANVIRA